jgi:hypothetical protein
MKIKNHLLERLTIALVAVAMVIGLASMAQARVHSLSGNARFQIGGGLPIPVTAQPIPNDRVLAIGGAIVHQTTGPDPKLMRIPPSQMANGLPNFPTPAVNAPVFINNPAVFQVFTNIPIQFPAASATFSAGGRTGASIVRVCAGQTVPPAGNPNCGGPLSGPLGTANPGRMIYTATGAQFGGVARGVFGGSANVGLVAGGVPPGVVSAIFYNATPAGTGAWGGTFGVTVGSANVAPSPSGFGIFTATAGGALTNAISPSIGPGLANTPTSYGGPWTTGVVTIQQPAALGGAETFVISGNDGRVSGVGPISLVAGTIAQRTVSGPNANRGWLNLVVGTPTVATPAVSGYGLAAAFGLLVLAGGYALRRRVRG